ncbi:MAG TPA: transcription-repair coupling factor [Tepidisphaeraceae bacterium]|jgi:transcription-repair coupling factor (superfamily II helicase)|nr:transcription-repair coupling factor [Tepidisphaeraceae bacterium]
MSNSTPPEVVGRLVAARPLKQLADTVRTHRAASAAGLWGSSVALVVAAIHKQLGQRVLFICGHLDEGDDLADDVELFGGFRPDVMPALELGGSLGRVSEEQVSNRLQMVSKYATGKADAPVLVAPIQALMQAVPSRNQLQQLLLTLKPGMAMEPEKLIVWLSEHGYNRLDQVEVPGDFAVRGGIIDIYMPGNFEEAGEMVGLTVRVDFFGDEIESIRKFDLDTLGSGDKLENVRVMDLKGQLDSGDSTSIFTYLPPDTVVVLWEPLEIAEQAKSYFGRLPDVKGIYPLKAVLAQAAGFPRLELSQFDQGTSAAPSLVGDAAAGAMKLPITSLQRFETEAKKALRELAELAETHEVVVYCENEGEAKRFCELLEADVSSDACKKIKVPIGYLHRGFVWDSRTTGGSPVSSDDAEEHGRAARGTGKPIALLGHHELFHRYEQRRRVKKVVASRPVDSFLDLKVGDYVVHVAHGIAKFTGIQTLSKDGKNDEYLTLRFAENATLHVPATRVNLIQKYIGGFQGHPQLSRLGSGVWEKQKAKVAEAVMDMAAELIEVQAARAAEKGVSYPPDTEWQREFEAEFPYEPTVDQLTSAEEIKQDMQKHRPMDRLLCGDVGYGKTEMAMRAAFKAVEYGKQVAVLVPTTVLAEQHHRSFKERMVNYPFNVESVSRFKSSKEIKETLKRTAAGEVDVLIGTHRIFSKDVKFADLGLVVIDEEQRFGVTHKEKLKQMRKTVDVLTMSATPIPRTLHMSMLGLRDISSLTTAPQDRRSIVTEVATYDKSRIKMAVLRELNRGGQVYFVHNRVYNILDVADELQQLVPDARIIVGHGQMEDGELEDVMMKFIRHEADILVATTIIESGLDIPNANTIFINKADRFGLSELHQLRGRVGRYKNRAYCYLLLPPDRPVTPVAAKRLKAIEEYSHLGAGFKIAMRDLEIRGSGNILGPEQSGHIATVGYEMYCQLLEEATRQLKNEPKATTPEAHVDIGISAFIPKTYITADRQRLDVYRRMTRCTSLDMLHLLEQDMKDAFGDPPRQVVVLFALTEMRLLCQIFGVESIIKKAPDVVLTVRDAKLASEGLTNAPGTLRVIDDKTVYLRMPPTFMESETLLMVLRNLMKQNEEKKRGVVKEKEPALAAK